MAFKDYYKILGVDRKASKDELRRAYRKLARELHPDVNPDNPKAKDRFIEVQEAYDVLSDVEKRRKYDMFGTADAHGGPGGGFRWTGSSGPGGVGDINIEDLFGGDVFSSVFGRGAAGGFGGTRVRPGRKGQDVAHEMSLSFEQAVSGLTAAIEIEATDGSGRRERLDVKIPPGVDNGQKIRLKGKGRPGMGGGPPGDLFIVARIGPHPYFRRDGCDIALDLPLTLTEAALGTKVTIPTLDGSAVVTVPPGTRSGRRLRLRGRGVRKPKSDQRGDQYAVVQIVPPKQLDPDARELLEKLARATNDDPRTNLGWKL